LQAGPRAAISLVPNIDARYLWLSSQKRQMKSGAARAATGLLRILLDPVVGPVVSELDSEQGLPSQNVFAVQPQRKADGSDVLLIGTNRGVARYEPGRFEPSLSATRILSKRVHAPSELQAGLNLEYPQNSLAARCNGNQQPHVSRAVSVCVHACRQQRPVDQTETIARIAVHDGGFEAGHVHGYRARVHERSNGFGAVEFFVHSRQSAFSMDLDGAGNSAGARVAGSVVGHP
jgi:hypothetical protein